MESASILASCPPHFPVDQPGYVAIPANAASCSENPPGPGSSTSHTQNSASPTVSPSQKACPWSTVSPTTKPVSLAEVMSEELAHSLHREEQLKLNKTESSPETSAEDITPPNIDPDCCNDFLLAQMLQMEFDKEYDEMLLREEKHINGHSKVSVSYGKYRRLPDSYFQEEMSSCEEKEERRHWDSFEEAEKTNPTIGKNGIARCGNTYTTKHDLTVCGRKNACRVMEFPPGISTGDGGGFDMKLSNSVYNKLKVHSMSEERRTHRVHDKKEKSTAEQAFDPDTRLVVYKLVGQQLLDSVNGCISTGKEACVFHAFGGENSERAVPSECAIKVFKTMQNEFKNRDQYIKEDYRFKDRFSKQNQYKMIRMWAEKEMHNLKRMRKAGLPCPEVVILKKHVLVMTFIGLNQKPAPKLKDANLTATQLDQAYAQTVEIMKKLYRDCRLVHADMSEYNLLWHNSQVWVIDVSQSVEPNHPNALEFLIRDCTNISEFFKKQGIANVMDAKQLFTEVCGVSLPGEGVELLSNIENYERDEDLMLHGPKDKKADVFEILFEKCRSRVKPSLQAGIPREITTGKENHFKF